MMTSLEIRIEQLGSNLRLLLLLVGILFAFSVAAQADTFHVTNTNDSGAGSLRDAITQSNNSSLSTPNLIDFQIQPSGGVQTINLQSALPAITVPVIINGTTQPGWGGTPIIELNGANAGGVDALTISAGGSTVKGLVINHFNKGIVLTGKGGNTIVGNYIGTNAAGDSILGLAGACVYIQSSGNVIGGTTPAERNLLLSGQNNTGIYIIGASATGNSVKGNYIGTYANGTSIPVNGFGNASGLSIVNAPHNLIGGTTPAERNVISGNNWGIQLSGSATASNIITGNYIGMGADGTTALFNATGIIIDSQAHGNIIGGPNPGEGNLIANDYNGIFFHVSAGAGNLIRGNSIFASSNLGIDLKGSLLVLPNDSLDGDTGPNDLQNYPVITSAAVNGNKVDIAGTLNSAASRAFTVDLYSNLQCNKSGNGEGRTFIAAVPVTTDSNGDASFSTSVPLASVVGSIITAVATSDTNSTSEFSQCYGTTSVAGTLQFAAQSFTVNKNAGQATITATRTGGSSGMVSVNYATSDGTAKQPADYTATSGTLTWADGDNSSKTFTVPIIDNNLSNSDKTVNLTLSNPTNGALLGVPSTAVLTIKFIQSSGDLQFSSATYSVNENGGQATVTVTRKNGSFAAVSVNYGTSDGTAKNSIDYTAASGTLTWANADASSKTFTVPIINNNISDSNRTINLSLYSPVGAKLGAQSTAVLTIVDDEPPVDPADLVVKNTNDSGHGSLRQAILTANQLPGKDTITFQIGSGVQSIAPASQLPDIKDTVTIDATTQPGFAGQPIIELNGTNAGANAIGLIIKGPGCVIKGLVINRFNDRAIQIDSDGNTISGNYLGTDVTGANGLGNKHGGIYINSNNNIIGGTTPADRNIISGNHGSPAGAGALVIQGGNNKVTGNYIGTDVTGSFGIFNSDGIIITNGTGNIIGGKTAAERNVISGQQSGYGIIVGGTAKNNVIQGNYIGTKADGTAAPQKAFMGNAYGVSVSNSAHDNLIGGANAGEGNLIAYNYGPGVVIESTAFNNSILGNSIYSNAQSGTAYVGIELFGNQGVTPNDAGDADTGGNNLQNFPVLTSIGTQASNTVIQGTLNTESNKKYRIEFFSNTQCNSLGYGEGEHFLGSTDVTTDANGNASLTLSTPSANVKGTFFTATATDPQGNTSEFSQCVSAASVGAGTLQFGSSNEGVFENAGKITVTVTRTDGSTGTVKVDYATGDYPNAKYKATAGIDYTPVNGTLTFNDGETSKTIDIPLINDTLSEPQEYLRMTLSNPQGGATLGNQNTTDLSIIDDDLPTVSINDVQVKEGDAGTTIATFTVSLTRAYYQDGHVDFATVDGTATGGADYQPTSGSLTFIAGETSKTITVLVNGDTTKEPDEAFFVQLSNNDISSFTKAKGTCTILDDDAAQGGATVQFSQGSYNVKEDEPTAKITVTRSGDLSATASVDFMTSDQSGMTPCQTNNNGIASERCDYATVAGTLHFAPGESQKTIQIPLINDAYVEPAEVFQITLSNPKGISLGDTSSANVIINSDDVQQAVNNPIDNQAFFIRQQYIDFLNRIAEPAGFQFWMDRMNNCPAGQTCDRTDTSQRFFQSDEFQERGFYVYRLYDAVLGRLPKYAEFVPDVARLSGYQTPQEQQQNKSAYLLDFVTLQEFKATYGQYLTPDSSAATDAVSFVNALCQKAGVTPSNTQSLIDNLQSKAKSPAQTVEDFILSQEVSAKGTKFYDRGFITMQYFGYLRRDPDMAGFDFWQQKMVETNHDYRFMVGGFLQSDEYHFRFALLPAAP